MTPGAHVAATIELLEKIWDNRIRASKSVKKYFAQMRFAGS